MRFLAIVIALFTLSISTQAQEGKIEGKVTNSKNRAAANGVSAMVASLVYIFPMVVLTTVQATGLQALAMRWCLHL